MLRRVFVFLFVLLWHCDLQAQAPFYQGKTIRLVAGTPAGSVYDSYARLVAQFMPKYTPGTPNIIVQNMPGVASMVAANYISSIAKRDGLTIGAIQPALYFDQLVGRKRLELDPVSGEDLQALASEIVAQPPEVVERMKKLLGT